MSCKLGSEVVVPTWFSNLVFWSAQVALLAGAGAILPRLFRLQQPRVLLAYWRGLLVLSFALPVLQPWQHVAFRLEMNNVVAFPDPHVLPPPTTGVAHLHFSTQEIAWIVCAVVLVGIVLRLALLIAGMKRLKQFREDRRRFRRLRRQASWWKRCGRGWDVLQSFDCRRTWRRRSHSDGRHRRFCYRRNC